MYLAPPEVYYAELPHPELQGPKVEHLHGLLKEYEQTLLLCTDDREAVKQYIERYVK